MQKAKSEKWRRQKSDSKTHYCGGSDALLATDAHLNSIGNDCVWFCLCTPPPGTHLHRYSIEPRTDRMQAMCMFSVASSNRLSFEWQSFFIGFRKKGKWMTTNADEKQAFWYDWKRKKPWDMGKRSMWLRALELRPMQFCWVRLSHENAQSYSEVSL